jgi:hypothetical protein
MSYLGKVGTDPCAPCVTAKSVAYAACRKISATAEPAKRKKCFTAADATLKQCLNKCKPQKPPMDGLPQAAAVIATIWIVAGIFAGNR